MNDKAKTMEWKWGKGPYLEKFYPWEYPQFHLLQELNPADIWNRKRRISLYVHIPFCKEKCHYCNYFSFPQNLHKYKSEYLAALKQEISLYSKQLYHDDVEVNSLSIGGGTPSLLEDEQFDDLVKHILKSFNFMQDFEFTTEVHPNSVTNEKLHRLKAIGVNRLSIGIQSFDDRLLKEMGRPYNAQDAINVISLIREIPFENINIDLIYGYPTQSLEEWTGSLKKALSFQPERITCGSISIHPKTALYQKVKKQSLPRANANIEREMMEAACDIMTEAGYKALTMLSFGRANIEYKLQMNTLKRGQELVGMGLSSFSCINGYAYINTVKLDEYLEKCNTSKLPVHRGLRISKELEISMAAVHSIKTLGIDKLLFKRRFGVDIETIYGEVLRNLEEHRMIHNSENKIELTRQGMFYMGQVAREFYLSKPYIPEDLEELYELENIYS